MFLKADIREKKPVLSVFLASLYFSIIIFLPFLHNHPLEVGKPEPVDCPAHMFIVTSNGIVNNPLPVILFFILFISYLLPANLPILKNNISYRLRGRAPPLSL